MGPINVILYVHHEACVCVTASPFIICLLLDLCLEFGSDLGSDLL